MIGDRELLEKYIKPYHGPKNPNLYVEFSTGAVVSSYILLEDGFDILQEDGVYRLILES